MSEEADTKVMKKCLEDAGIFEDMSSDMVKQYYKAIKESQSIADNENQSRQIDQRDDLLKQLDESINEPSSSQTDEDIFVKNTFVDRGREDDGCMAINIKREVGEAIVSSEAVQSYRGRNKGVGTSQNITLCSAIELVSKEVVVSAVSLHIPPPQYLTTPTALLQPLYEGIASE